MTGGAVNEEQLQALMTDQELREALLDDPQNGGISYETVRGHEV